MLPLTQTAEQLRLMGMFPSARLCSLACRCSSWLSLWQQPPPVSSQRLQSAFTCYVHARAVFKSISHSAPHACYQAVFSLRHYNKVDLLPTLSNTTAQQRAGITLHAGDLMGPYCGKYVEQRLERDKHIFNPTVSSHMWCLSGTRSFSKSKCQFVVIRAQWTTASQSTRHQHQHGCHLGTGKAVKRWKWQ